MTDKKIDNKDTKVINNDFSNANITFQPGSMMYGGDQVFNHCTFGKDDRVEIHQPEDLRPTQRTFKTKVDRKRLDMLYVKLQQDGLIANTVELKQIYEIFSGEPSDCVIRWTGHDAILCHFIKRLIERKYIEELGGEPWVVVRNHFRNKDNEFFTDNLRMHKAPKKFEEELEVLVSLLSPEKLESDELPFDEFSDGIDSYSGMSILK